MDLINIIFTIAVLIMSIVAHEVAHGYAAERLGDSTARMAGRLTLNPVAHLDVVGSFIVPVATFFLSDFIFGWAKPVPYNPNNMRNPRRDGALVAAAGPLTNLLIALVFGLLIRFASAFGIAPTFLPIVETIVFLNILLAVFNSIPVPPLDGSKVLFAVLPYRFYYFERFLEQYWWVFIFAIIFFLWKFLLSVISFLFTLITGL